MKQPTPALVPFCAKHDISYTSFCPWCAKEDRLAQRIVIAEPHRDLIKRLMDGYPFQARDKELHDECKRVLGE